MNYNMKINNNKQNTRQESSLFELFIPAASKL